MISPNELKIKIQELKAKIASTLWENIKDYINSSSLYGELNVLDDLLDKIPNDNIIEYVVNYFESVEESFESLI